MKKRILATAMLVMALGITACSSKNEETSASASIAETTAAETSAEASALPSAGSQDTEAIDEESISGIITAIDGDILTIQGDDDGTEKAYDISNAQITQEFPFSEGDIVYLSFPAETTEDPIPLLELEVEESVIGQNTDPSTEGTVVEITENTIILQLEDGETYALNSGNAYVVAKEGIAVDKKATVTYIGDLEDEAMAVKIVMEDSYDTPEAEQFALIGKTAQVSEDGSSIVLESEQGEFFTFFSSEIDFSEFKEGSVLEIAYSGTITAKEIPALSVTEK